MNKTLTIGGITLLLVLLLVSLFIFSSQRSTDILTQEEAISVVIEKYSELGAYRTTSLPLSSIEAKKVSDGWDVGFIQSGSGLPGILNAKCYHVTVSKNATLIGEYSRQGDKTVEGITLETCTPVFTEGSAPELPPTSPSDMLPYGNVTLRLNELATFRDISIRPLLIEEDSRCPNDVQCIQAGTVRVKIAVVSGAGTSESVLKLGQVFTTEGKAILLENVLPVKNSKVITTAGDYRFVFNVVQQGSSKNPTDTQGKCYIGGCSSQLCTDAPDALSTCEYKPEYSCYKSATCERQSNGACGWTETIELTSCLAHPSE